MSKDVVVSRVAESLEISKSEANRIFETVFGALTEAIVEGEVRIHKFGKFQIKDRAARKGRNPRTGEAVDIPASKKIKFSAATDLKERVNG